MKDMKHLKLQLRLTFYAADCNGPGIFGKGIAALLRGIEEHGSLNASAKNMQMAYSKAWRRINDTEASFGFNLITRDGARGSALTPEGKKLLDIFEELEASGIEYLNERLSELI